MQGLVQIWKMCSDVFYWMRRLKIRLPSELQGDRSVGPWRCCLSSATHSKPGSGSQINSSLLTCASHFADYIVDRHEKRQLCWARQAFSAFDSGKNLFGFALTQSPFLQNFFNLLRRNLQRNMNVYMSKNVTEAQRSYTTAEWECWQRWRQCAN